MAPNTPLTTREFVHAVWAFGIGLAGPRLILGPLFWWLDRRRHRRWQREQDERQRQWAQQRAEEHSHDR